MRKTRTPPLPKPARGRRTAQPLSAGAKRKAAAAEAEPAAALSPIPPAPVAAAAEPARPAKTSDYGHGTFAAMMRSSVARA